MHALRQIHRALVPGGLLLDMHPVPPATRAEVSGVSLGDFEDEEFFDIVRATERPLAETDLFVLEDEREFDYLERYDSAEELLEDVGEWGRLPRAPCARRRDPGGDAAGRHLGASDAPALPV